ncbi:dispanin subfamily A member 2b-like [Heliangelus exortis]|uniref:dispanin subfamily A member 2b-like n=1 Tax=Heliangelus exortis TaxID=472823 RepID=UPI003A91FFCD
MEHWCSPGPAVSPYKPLSEGLDMEDLPPRTVVTVEQPPLSPPPRDHLAWSLCTALYSNICCVGFLALVFSIKSRDRKVLGDFKGALSYSSTSKYLNITALVLNILFIIIVIIVLVTTGIMAGVHYQQENQPYLGPS